MKTKVAVLVVSMMMVPAVVPLSWSPVPHATAAPAPAASTTPPPSSSPAPPAAAQAPAPGKDAAIHDELRKLRDGVLDAMNKGDVERELSYLHPNVVITWYNSDVSRGRDGVRAYLNHKLEGPDKLVTAYHVDADVDELTILYGGGDTGIAFGSAREHYQLARGGALDLQTRWTATVVKEGGQWLIASLHKSVNLFDNPVLWAVRATAHWAMGLGPLLGLAVGLFVGRWRRSGARPAGSTGPAA